MPQNLAKCYTDVNSILHIPSCSNLLLNVGMRNKDIRRANLLYLIGDAQKRGLNQRQYSEEVEINPGHMSQMKTGEREVGDEITERLEKFHNFPEGWMDTPHEPGDPKIEPLGVPMLGYVRGGLDGYYVELDLPTGGGSGMVRYPMKDPNTYALRVRGDSMRPRIKPGEFIVVEPNHAYIIGDDVMVKLVDDQGVERAMVKILSKHGNGEYEFRSINETEHPPITVEEKNVKAIHYIGAIAKPSWYYERT